MGNSTSSTYSNNPNDSAEKKFDNFYEIVDYIATYYILTMDFQSLSKLSEHEYCDNLVVLTSDIIKKYFNDMDITYLAQRVSNGLEVNELTTENVSFFNKDQLNNLDISNDKNKSIKKKRVCLGIAKFYVKIAHIFSAIIMTINPIYKYKDANGNIVKNTLMEKDKIPKNVKRKVYKMNICDNRIRALNRGDNYNHIEGDKTKIHPKVCDFNVDTNGTVKTLADEPGIKELMTLYLDDNYDYSTGAFTGMSDATKKLFMRDLKTFYTAFTGKPDMPPEITKFSDIKLRDFNSINGCQGETPALKNVYSINKNEKLFKQYADNINKMINSASSKQSELLDIINILFTYVLDPYSGKKKIRVNPKLNEATLQKAVEDTRKIIIQLYVKCETDFLEGIKLYEAIVEAKILETTTSQIKNLEKKATKIVADSTRVKPYNPDDFKNNNMTNETANSDTILLTQEQTQDQAPEQTQEQTQDQVPTQKQLTPQNNFDQSVYKQTPELTNENMNRPIIQQ